MTYKSPLRYPGGKSRAERIILANVPRNETDVSSMFLGGGSIEIALCQNGTSVRAYDNSYDLITFWEMVLRDPEGLARQVESLFFLKLQEMDARFFRRLQAGRSLIDDPKSRAAAFFTLNRASYSGTTLAGGMSRGFGRLNHSAIGRLREFSCPNLRVYCQDFRISIPANTHRFLFLDPPYALPTGRNTLYGLRGRTLKSFDHLALFHLLRARPHGGFILCYNNCDFIRDLYRDYKQIPIKWTYCMNRTKKSSEILIVA